MPGRSRAGCGAERGWGEGGGITLTTTDWPLIEGIARSHGVNFARGVMDAIAAGELTDMGACERPVTQPVIAPTWEPIRREVVAPRETTAQASFLDPAREIQQMRLGA